MEVCRYICAPAALAPDKGPLVFIDQNIECTPEAAERVFWRTEKFLALSDIDGPGHRRIAVPNTIQPGAFARIMIMYYLCVSRYNKTGTTGNMSNKEVSFITSSNIFPSTNTTRWRKQKLMRGWLWIIITAVGRMNVMSGGILLFPSLDWFLI